MIRSGRTGSPLDPGRNTGHNSSSASNTRHPHRQIRHPSTSTTAQQLGSSSSSSSSSPTTVNAKFQQLLGPASLVGGTAAMYTSLLQHPSSTLTQLSFVLMMLLAVQYAVQPRLAKRYISPKLNKQSVALVEEVVKTGLAAAVFCSKPSNVVQGALKGESGITCLGLSNNETVCCCFLLSSS
jgi:hypothetical protein